MIPELVPDTSAPIDPLELPSSTRINVVPNAKGVPRVVLDVRHVHGETRVAWNPRNAIKIARALTAAAQAAMRGELVVPEIELVPPA